ncbi:unnamed protein product [Nippostrongylus brasiliensis]|uniref:Uncharacterized protein n=1 Tax=Nippostrongylus brasiliensis TaxID=27835 RepID=A0A0N4YEU8_NIPBR|nr:unnamed protein product [Nippostrongylus brasiliensis]
MIDYTIFECEIEPTLEKGVAEIRQRKDDKPSSKISPCSLTRDHRLQSIRKHLEQVVYASIFDLFCVAYLAQAMAIS